MSENKEALEVQKENQENKTQNRPKRKSKVAVCGFAPSWSQIPWGDQDMEVWGINALYGFFDQMAAQGKPVHIERWFDMHRISEIIAQDDDGKHLPWLKGLAERNILLFTCDASKEISNAIEYPIAQVEETLCMPRAYWTNTISYLIALAITEKKLGHWEELEEIHIYGVDMAQDSEYAHQRPSCEFLIGIALGAGIKVFIPQESDLLRSPYRYGYDNCPIETSIFRDKIKEHERQITALQEQRQKCIAWYNQQQAKFNQDINNIDGAINQIRGAVDMSYYYIRSTFAKNNKGVVFDPSFKSSVTDLAKEIKKNIKGK